VHRVEYICGPCRDKGVKRVCLHKLDSLPHWSSSTKVDRIQALLGDEEEEVFQREGLGIVDHTDGPYVFPKDKIREAFALPRVSIRDPVRFVYMVIDPAAGSDIAAKATSQFAIVSICHPNTTIVGLEAFDIVAVGSDFKPTLIEHVRKIRALPFFGDCHIVVDVESGTGTAARDAIACLQDEFLNIIPIKDFTRKYGTTMLNTIKEELVLLTRTVLEMGDVRVYDRLVTSHPHPNTIIGRLKDQLMEYARHVIVGTGPKAHNSVIYHGKGENRNKMDDLALSFQRAIRARRRFWEEPAYAYWRSR